MMEFKIVATRDQDSVQETKFSPTVAVARARVLISEGWYAEILTEDGSRYQATTFDDLLSFRQSHPLPAALQENCDSDLKPAP